MKSSLFVLSSLLFTHAARAHVTYTGRDFGTLQGGGVFESSSLTVANISGDFGWAASTDANYGDSHRTRAFRFHLANSSVITITAQATTSGFLPGFSLYAGLAHLAPDMNSHDASQLSLDYLATLSGPPKVGAMFGLGDWAIGNDPVYNTPGDSNSGIAIPASLRYFTYIGNAADGTAANYGSAPGIAGDGVADGLVTRTFTLAAGDYSVFLGGANLAGEGPPNPTYPNYGSILTLAAVPEPSCVALALPCLLLMFRRRRG